MEKLLEKLEGLFIVERKETSYKKFFISFIILLALVASLPAYFKYEDYNYAKYKREYDYVVDIIKKYEEEHGNYPLGETINWDKEKNLNLFFTENNFSKNRELRYIDTNLLPELESLKYTYIIDANKGNIYTAQFVVYKNRRWHLAFY